MRVCVCWVLEKVVVFIFSFGIIILRGRRGVREEKRDLPSKFREQISLSLSPSLSQGQYFHVDMYASLSLFYAIYLNRNLGFVPFELYTYIEEDRSRKLVTNIQFMWYCSHRTSNSIFLNSIGSSYHYDEFIFRS